MYLLDLTLPTPAENLALEEALLYHGEITGNECLRLWESSSHFVVLGAGSPLRRDVNVDECLMQGIPILRRCSGGGTVLQGPGCLNFTLVLDRQLRPELETIASTNQFILGKIAQAVATAQGIDSANVPAIQGISDLTIGDLKFSGNAQRRRKRFVLFHGTILHGFDLAMLAACLGVPEKMPDYRSQREHGSFVTNIQIDAARLKAEIASKWGATTPLADWPEQATNNLATTRYADRDWVMSI